MVIDKGVQVLVAVRRNRVRRTVVNKYQLFVWIKVNHSSLFNVVQQFQNFIRLGFSVPRERKGVGTYGSFLQVIEINLVQTTNPHSSKAPH